VNQPYDSLLIPILRDGEEPELQPLIEHDVRLMDVYRRNAIGACQSFAARLAISAYERHRVIREVSAELDLGYKRIGFETDFLEPGENLICATSVPGGKVITLYGVFDLDPNPGIVEFQVMRNQTVIGKFETEVMQSTLMRYALFSTCFVFQPNDRLQVRARSRLYSKGELFGFLGVVCERQGVVVAEV
jgi:hypothetical protein